MVGVYIQLRVPLPPWNGLGWRVCAGDGLMKLVVVGQVVLWGILGVGARPVPSSVIAVKGGGRGGVQTLVCVVTQVVARVSVRIPTEAHTKQAILL